MKRRGSTVGCPLEVAPAYRTYCLAETDRGPGGPGWNLSEEGENIGTVRKSIDRGVAVLPGGGIGKFWGYLLTYNLQYNRSSDSAPPRTPTALEEVI
eukprot:scaffold885_cov209-Skeletonema_marinoi.AAC.15